jgi:hypothetical protein
VKVLRMTTDQLATDDRIADLLIEYAMVLGKAEDSDTVVLPVVREGQLEEASILLGPASQITLTESHDPADAAVQIPNVEAVVADLRARIARFTGDGGAQDEDVPIAEAFSDFGDF